MPNSTNLLLKLQEMLKKEEGYNNLHNLSTGLKKESFHLLEIKDGVDLAGLSPLAVVLKQQNWSMTQNITQLQISMFQNNNKLIVSLLLMVVKEDGQKTALR